MITTADIIKPIMKKRLKHIEIDYDTSAITLIFDDSQITVSTQIKSRTYKPHKSES